MKLSSFAESARCSKQITHMLLDESSTMKGVAQVATADIAGTTSTTAAIMEAVARVSHSKSSACAF